MNVIAQLEYELVYYDTAVHRFNHYTTRIPTSLPTVVSHQVFVIKTNDHDIWFQYSVFNNKNYFFTYNHDLTYSHQIKQFTQFYGVYLVILFYGIPTLIGSFFCPVVWGCRIYRLYLCRGRRCPWCNGYLHWKWTRRHEFKSWTRLIAFHIALIPLRKVWIQLFSLQLRLNSRADWVLQPWWGNLSKRRKILNSNLLNSA